MDINARGSIRGPRDAGGDVGGCVGGGGVGEVPLLPLISGEGWQKCPVRVGNGSK